MSTNTKQSAFDLGTGLPNLEGNQALAEVASPSPQENPFESALTQDPQSPPPVSAERTDVSHEGGNEPVSPSEAKGCSVPGDREPVPGDSSAMPGDSTCAVPGCGIVLSKRQVAFCGPHFLQIPPLIAASIRRFAVAPYGEQSAQFQGAVASALRAIERIRRNYETKKAHPTTPERADFSKEKI